jgi:transposase InsO family protein
MDRVCSSSDFGGCRTRSRAAGGYPRTPTTIKSDNGPELVARRVQDWLFERGVATRYIDPGSPWQNGHNESFNSVFRDGRLNRWLFSSVREAKLIVESWRIEYNTERPHGALDGETPAAYAAGLEQENREAA